MADENESTIADATGPIEPGSPVKSPADVQAMFDTAKFGTLNKHIHYQGDPSPGCIYVMQAREFVKIGIAGDPQKRLKNIQIGCPMPVSLVRAWRLSDEYYALLAEKVSHRWLAEYRAMGEWFEMPAAEAVAVVDQVARAAIDLSHRHNAPIELTAA